MNKGIIRRRPLKIFCDRCWLCFYFCLISPRQLVEKACGWARHLLPLAVVPPPTWFLHLLLETARKFSPHPLPPPAIYQPYGPGEIAETLAPLRHHWVPKPWFAHGVKPSHPILGTTEHFSWGLAQSQPWFLFSSHLLLFWVFMKSLPTTYPVCLTQKDPWEEWGYKCKRFSTVMSTY